MQLLRYRKFLTQVLSQNLSKGFIFLLYYYFNIKYLLCLLYFVHAQNML